MAARRGSAFSGAAGRRITKENRLPTGVSVQLTIRSDLEAQVASSVALRDFMVRLTDRIANLANAQCPVDLDPHHGAPPGNLRRSQMHEVIPTPTGPHGVVGYTAFYAHMVHNGTAHSAPNPWLLNAAIYVMRRSLREIGAAHRPVA